MQGGRVPFRTRHVLSKSQINRLRCRIKGRTSADLQYRELTAWRHERVSREAIHGRGSQLDLIKLLQADRSQSIRRFYMSSDDFCNRRCQFVHELEGTAASSHHDAPRHVDLDGDYGSFTGVPGVRSGRGSGKPWRSSMTTFSRTSARRGQRPWPKQPSRSGNDAVHRALAAGDGARLVRRHPVRPDWLDVRAADAGIRNLDWNRERHGCSNSARNIQLPGRRERDRVDAADARPAHAAAHHRRDRAGLDGPQNHFRLHGRGARHDMRRPRYAAIFFRPTRRPC